MLAPFSLRHPRRMLAATAALALLGTACRDTTAVDRTPQSRLRPGDRAAVVTPTPSSVTVAGSLQSELGCSGDWDPGCAATHLTYDANDDVWQATWTLPSGSYEYKAALNDSWDENYGAGAVQNGPNIALTLGASTAVKFYYDHETHWITDDVNSVIAIAAGSFQSELGCSADWDQGCLRSWLEDPDGNGVFTLSTTAIPAGSYETKVAIHESWDENYGAGGTPNGANIPFTVPQTGSTVDFAYDGTTHVLTVTVTAPTAQSALSALRDAVAASGIKATVRTGLTDKLDAAIAALANGQTNVACRLLVAFESQVQSQRGKAIPESTADAWLAESSAIRGALGC